MKSTSFLVIMFCSLSAQEPIGLVNVGNTCYQNASLQCMYNITGLTDFLLATAGTDYYIWQRGGKNTIAQAYTALVTQLRTTAAGTFTPLEFCSRAWDVFNLPERTEEDARDFTTYLIEHLAHKDVADAYKKNYYGYPLQNYIKTFVDQLLNVFTENTLVCSTCKSKSIIYESNPLLLLSVVNDQGAELTTLTDCLRHFCRTEVVPDYQCPVCGGKVEKSFRLFTAPETMVLCLKRFKKIPHQPSQKITHPIALPFTATLDNLDFFSSLSAQLPAADYELTGITIHSGSLEGGHYWAYVRTPNGTWYKADDSAVTALDRKNVVALSTQGYLDNPLYTPYILYYSRKRPLPMAPITTQELLQKFKTAGITQSLLNDFLAQEITAKNALTTINTLVEGINQGLVTVDNLIAQIHGPIVSSDPQKDLVTLTVSLQALSQSLTA